MQSSASLGASCAANPRTFLYMSGLMSLKVFCMCDARVFFPLDALSRRLFPRCSSSIALSPFQSVPWPLAQGINSCPVYNFCTRLSMANPSSRYNYMAESESIFKQTRTSTSSESMS